MLHHTLADLLCAKSICAFLLTYFCGECLFTSKGGNTSASGASRPATANNDSDKYASVPAQNAIANSNNDDDFDDFDPRGTSGKYSSVASVLIVIFK